MHKVHIYLLHTESSQRYSLEAKFTVTSTSGFYPLPPLNQCGLKMVCNVNIVYGILKSESSQEYAQKPQRNCMFMNSASEEREKKKKIVLTCHHILNLWAAFFLCLLFRTITGGGGLYFTTNRLFPATYIKCSLYALFS